MLHRKADLTLFKHWNLVTIKISLLLVTSMLLFSCSNKEDEPVDPGPDFASELAGIYIDSLLQMDGSRVNYKWIITKISNSTVQVEFFDTEQAYSGNSKTSTDTARNVKIDNLEKLAFKFLSNKYYVPARIEIVAIVVNNKLRVSRKVFYSDGGIYEDKMNLTKI